MKKAFALLATATMATSLVAPTAQARPWSLKGESKIWYWDISNKRDKSHYLVIHTDRSRWISRDRLRVEFTIRTGRNTGKRLTWSPYTLYDEASRCDNGKVCDPPLFPVLDYDNPYKTNDANNDRWYTHSVTVDCKNAPYMLWRPQDRRLGMRDICREFRTTVR